MEGNGFYYINKKRKKNIKGNDKISKLINITITNHILNVKNKTNRKIAR